MSLEDIVIKGLENCKNEESVCGKDCPYADIPRCLPVLREDALKVIKEQKAEIERLTKWKDKLQDTKDELEQQLIDTGFKEYCEENKRLTDENAELQKQVDELKGKICELVADKCNLVVKEQQAVKDTAKEILTNALEGFVFNFTANNEDYRSGYDKAIDDYDEKLRKFVKERYGIEVE